MPTYQRPGFMTVHVFNPLIAFATRLGLGMRGSRVLAVRGRKSGEWRTMPVNPLSFEGERYLVAPRGETQWVRNLRVARECRLQVGRTTETVRVEEVSDAEKPPILRAYLARWRSETGKFFGVSKDPGDEELARVAPNHPVFRVVR